MDAGLAGGGAGTSLRASLLALNNPAKAQAKIMDKLGFSITDSAGEAKSLSQIVGDLAESTKDMTAAEKVATVGKLVGTEAVSGFLALMAAGPKVIDEMSDALVNSDGAAAETAAKMMAGIGGALEALGGTIDSFALKIGDKLAPYITLLANKLSDVDITPFIDGFGKAVDIAVSFAKAIAGGWGAVKGVVIPIVKALVTFGAVIATIAVGISTFAAIGTAIAFLVSPIGLVALGITALILGFQAAYKHSEPFRKVVDGLVSKVKALFAALTGDKIKSMNIMQKAGFTTEQIRGVYAFADKIKDAVKRISEVFKAVSSGDANGVMAALGFSPEMIAKVTEFVSGIKTKASEFVTYLKTKWTELQPSIAMLLERFTSLKDTAVNIFTTLWSFLQPIFGALGNAFMIIADIAVIAWTNIIAPTIDFVISMFQALWKVVGPILEFLGVAIGLAFEVLKIAWDTILKPVAKWLLGTFATAFEASKKHIDKISDSFSWLGDKISGVTEWFSKITDAVKNFKVPNWLSRLGGGGTVKFESNEGEGSGGKSHYHGIDYVPYDGYQITAHKGERLQTAQEVRESKRGTGGSPISISGNTFNVRQESDIQQIAYELAKLIEREGAQMA